MSTTRNIWTITGIAKRDRKMKRHRMPIGELADDGGPPDAPSEAKLRYTPEIHTTEGGVTMVECLLYDPRIQEVQL